MSKEREPKVFLLDAIGGEPLAGSGFEDEDPEQNFSMTEETAKE
jgi:hypothetical protein